MGKRRCTQVHGRLDVVAPSDQITLETTRRNIRCGLHVNKRAEFHVHDVDLALELQAEFLVVPHVTL